jgi:glycosyltransferase involved in cell wall biosynthesis
MKICKIWDADYPWDIRVEKVTTALSAAGHAVHLVCRNQGRGPRREESGSLTIHRLPPLPEALGPAHTFWNFPHPANPVWIDTIARTVRAIHADLILVRDLPLALPAAIVGKSHRIPVVLDMAENYPAMLEDKSRFTPTSAMGRLVRRPGLARLVERLVFRLADHIIVVIEESRERLIRSGVDPTRISVVSNTPRPDRWPLLENLPARQGRSESIQLIYLGNLDGSRGIDNAIRAVRHLTDQGHAVRLTVVGDGQCLSQLRDLSLRCGVADRLTFTGFLPFTGIRLQELMARADIGVIPHYATESWHTTIPNKLFDYMLVGLPVIVSDAAPAARIVRTEDCGEVFRDRDAEDLARCVVALRDPESRRRKGLRGRAAVERRYHWNYDAQVLVETIERVGAAGATSWFGRLPANALTGRN